MDAAKDAAGSVSLPVAIKGVIPKRRRAFDPKLQFRVCEEVGQATTAAARKAAYNRLEQQGYPSNMVFKWKQRFDAAHAKSPGAEAPTAESIFGWKDQSANRLATP